MGEKDWKEELKILLEREEEEILLAERVAKPYSGKRREDIYSFVEKELDKARKEGEGRILESIRMLNAIWSIYFTSKIYTKQDIFNHIDSFLSKLKE